MWDSGSPVTAEVAGRDLSPSDLNTPLAGKPLEGWSLDRPSATWTPIYHVLCTAATDGIHMFMFNAISWGWWFLFRILTNGIHHQLEMF